MLLLLLLLRHQLLLRPRSRRLLLRPNDGMLLHPQLVQLLQMWPLMRPQVLLLLLLRHQLQSLLSRQLCLMLRP